MDQSRLQAVKCDSLKKPGIVHGFMTREGGVSTGLYESLNCGYASQDEPENVTENRARVARWFGAAPEKLFIPYNVHGADCLQVPGEWPDEGRPEADALITDRADMLLGLLTADCAPVLFLGERAYGAPVIAASHAGWRGALHGVLENTVEKFRQMGVAPENIRAGIGPCIEPVSYEVSHGFEEAFMQDDIRAEHFFIPGPDPAKLLFDLPGYCTFRLARAGLTRVELLDEDTYKDKQRFFSARRAKHEGYADYGRLFSGIVMTG